VKLTTGADSMAPLLYNTSRRRNHVKFLCLFYGHKEQLSTGLVNENYLLLLRALALTGERA
jgi:hypothetical protein